jgi:hypothetical protein
MTASKSSHRAIGMRFPLARCGSGPTEHACQHLAGKSYEIPELKSFLRPALGDELGFFLLLDQAVAKHDLTDSVIDSRF